MTSIKLGPRATTFVTRWGVRKSLGLKTSMDLSSRDQPLSSGVQPLVTRVQPLVSRVQPLVSRVQPLVSRVQPLVSRDQPLGIETTLYLQETDL